MIEAFAFILPSLPNSLTVRLSILATYFIAYHFKLQYAYKRLKDKCVAQELEELAEERFLIHETDKTA